jgi:hypothetical protein
VKCLLECKFLFLIEQTGGGIQHDAKEMVFLLNEIIGQGMIAN